MQPGRLDYAYRLSAARVAILRLRFARYRQCWFQGPFSSARAVTLRGLAILCVISGSVWLGFQAGQQTKVDSVVLMDPPLNNPSSQSAGLPVLATSNKERPTRILPVVAAASMVPAVSESERAESRQAERREKAVRIAELVTLRRTVAKLQAQVQTLEQEATGLEIELLDQQMAFTRAEEQWKEASVERRVVYNITNIPIGGSVSEERIKSDAEQTEFPALENDVNDQAQSVDHDTDRQYSNGRGSVELWSEDDNPVDDLEQAFLDSNASQVVQTEGADGQTDGESAGRYSFTEPSPSSDLPLNDHTTQEVYFGPAADRFNDWDNQ